MNARPVELVVSMGDPQGVGPEVAVGAARRYVVEDLAARVVLVGDAAVLARAGADAAWPRIAADAPATAPVSVVATPAPRPLDAPPPSAAGGAAAMAALDVALARVRADARRALVTAPLGKEAVRAAGFASFDGHTGYVARACGVARPLMLFSAPGFKVALATVHVPLRRVAELVTAERLTGLVRTLAFELRRRYGIAAPRIDLLGINPHAGEGGAFGDEEATAIAPAVAVLRGEGLAVAGPFPADAYFIDGFRGRADAVVAMYHDQGLVAVKALAFREAVNVTLGLPLVRTSPDHGTAYAIAGKGTADATPTLAALREAATLLRATEPGRETDLPPDARAESA